MNKLLYPFSFLYRILSEADRFFTNPRTLHKPVISVGNLTWGGTGKTPVVIELLDFIIKQNIRPAVLTRGYGRRSGRPVMLKDGAPLANPAECGDEPLLIARSVPSAYVAAGSDRYGAAVKYKDEMAAGVFVLDDGFQHWKIKRDLDIVCVNAADPFGNGMIIPAGSLREKPEALKRAGLVIVTNADMVSKDALENLKKRIFAFSGKEAIITRYGCYAYKQMDLKNNFDIGKTGNKDFFILSGIGFCEGFRNSARKAGLNIKGVFALRDHKRYDKKLLYRFLDKAGGAYLLTTAKDAVKIDFFADDKIKERTAVLTVKPVFETGRQQWEKTILKSLRYSLTETGL